jgi:molybdopterin-biosynthesis enzyme MoeA-like protein
MDTKKLAQIIKVLVEAEVARKQEHFLTKIFPKILEEEVNNKFSKLLKETKTKTPTQVKEVDPFALAESVLKKERQQVQTKQSKEFTKNPVLNEILNQTQPFSSAQRSGLGGGTSILDTYQQPIQEAASYVPNYMDAEPDIDETMNFASINSQPGVDVIRQQMAAKMGYGDMATGGGLGVQTGVSHLDKALNRDYSQLVKRFKK